MKASRRTFMRFAVTVLAAVGVAVVVARSGRAEEIRAPMVAGETQPVYSAVGRLKGRRLESVLTSPVAGTSRGTGSTVSSTNRLCSLTRTAPLSSLLIA